MTVIIVAASGLIINSVTAWMFMLDCKCWCVWWLHGLHIWAVSTTDNALTAHLVMIKDQSHDELLHRAIGQCLASNEPQDLCSR